MPAEAINLNVTGRRVVGPVQGFGKMWQKTMRVELTGAQVTPAEVIKTWKAEFQRFWPERNWFYAPLEGIAPGEVALLNLGLPGRMKLSTGVLVLYADDESFTLMTPEGHMLAGWITFSAETSGGVTVVQIQALERTNDPSTSSATCSGQPPEQPVRIRRPRTWPATSGSSPTSGPRCCVDRRRQWRKAGNLSKNAAVRTFVWPWPPCAGCAGPSRARPASRDPRPPSGWPGPVGPGGRPDRGRAAVNTVQVATGEKGSCRPQPFFITTGAFLAGRRPANPVGWLLLGWGMVMAFGSFTGAYVNRGLVRDPGSLPGPSWVGWAEGVIWHPAFGLLAFLLLLFPHGRLPSPRWRPFAWFTVAIYLALSLAAALAPGSVELYYPEATPPVRLPVAGLADGVFEWLLPGQLLVLATALISLVVRLRRASGEERQQVKWFVYTVVTVVLVFVTTTLALGAGYLFPLFGLIPVSVAVAVFKYRCTTSTG